MADDATVRVGHCCPDAPNVDIAVNGDRVFENLGFTEFTEYASLPSGDHEISVMPTGSSDSVLDVSASIDGGTNYSILATGMVGDESLEANTFVDDPGKVPSDKTHARLIHASPDAPAVDVRVAGGPTVFENIGFREASDYEQLDPGTYDLEVVPSGSDDVALELPGTTLSGGGAISAVALGQLADDSLTAVVAEDALPVMEADD